MKTVFISRFVLRHVDLALNLPIEFVLRFAGVLSALGLALADVVHEMQEPSGRTIKAENWSQTFERFEHLSKCGTDELIKQGHDRYISPSTLPDTSFSSSAHRSLWRSTSICGTMAPIAH